jgi:RNA polymerase sigma-70 factor (ECF subfamily)
MIYCLIRPEVTGKARTAIERWYAVDDGVEVLTDHRKRERRACADRRLVPWDSALRPRLPERRRVHSLDGRRVAERRGVLVSTEQMMELPKVARRWADYICFAGLVQGTDDWLDDVEADRLVTRVQLGDLAAFEQLYKKWFNRVYRCLRIHTHDTDEVEEQLQEIFATVLDSLQDYDPQFGPFRCWLAQFVLQYSEPYDGMLDDDQDRVLERWPASADRHVFDWLPDDELFLLVSRLPAQQRDVVVLHYLLGVSPAQIAELLERPAEEIDEQHDRALRFMGACVAAVTRRPGYSGRHPMSVRRRLAPVTSVRRLALLA